MLNNTNKNQPQALLHSFLYDPNIYTSVVMKIKRKNDLSIDIVKKAVELAYTQNETTMSKVVSANGEIYFEKMPATGCKVSFDNRNWTDIINDNEKDAFKINEGELIRSFVIDDDSYINILVMAHNIVGDCNALSIFAEDILNNLAGQSVEYKPLNNNGEDVISSDLKLSFLKKLEIKSINNKWEKTGKSFNWEDYFCLHRRFWYKKQSHTVSATFKGHELNVIKEDCKNLGITLNSYIIAKQLEKAPNVSRIGIPVSYRGSNKSLSNKIMTMNIKFNYNTSTSFEKNAKELHKIILKHLENTSDRYEERLELLNLDPTILDGALMETHTSYRNEVAKKLCDTLGYSNDTKAQLGTSILDISNIKTDYDEFELIDFAYVAALTANTRNVISIATSKNSINVCCTSIK